jgi:KipI family sensor histidine kinase inhibitor
MMRILAQGEGGLVVELGDAIDDAINARVHALAAAVRDRLGGEIDEVVPSYRSLLILHDPVRTPRAGLERRVEALAAGLGESPVARFRRVVQLPVCYGGTLGPDLEEVAALTGRSAEAVVALHAAPVYRIHLLGFTPGFPYLGGLDPSLTVPRLEVPRSRIPPGSVAIGGGQTGVYPVESPGGWRLVGRTPLRLFDPLRPHPFLLAAGDGLRFVPITPEAFAAAAARAAAGDEGLEVEP